MTYNYLSLPLAIGITLLNVTSGISIEDTISENTQQNINHSAASIAKQTTDVSTTAQTDKSSYLGFMNAGYSANQKQDYLNALKYFQQALKLQPGDDKALQAIKNVSSYGFDLYMRSGYAADKIRDYTTALQNFQTALQIRPDSLHAKQAVSNVTHYIAQQPTSSTDSTSTDNQGNGLNLWLMLIGIGIASVFAGGLLFYLFKQTENSLSESELENTDLDKVMHSDSDSAAELPHQDREQKAEPETTNDAELPSKKENPEANNQNSVISSASSLARLDIIPELIQELNTSDRGMRRKAVWELAQRGDSRAMKPLVELMIEVDSQERGLILEAMTQIAGRTLKPMNKAIMMSLQDENTQVKQNAIRDLTRVYELMSQVTKRLSEAVEDSDLQVKETAKWALKKLHQMPANPSWQVDNFASGVTDFESPNQTNGSNSTNGVHNTREQRYF